MDWSANIELMWRENRVWDRSNEEDAMLEKEDGSSFDYASSLRRAEKARMENAFLDSPMDDTEYTCVPSTQYAIPKSGIEISRR